MTLFLVRGLPGAGKSTLAGKLVGPNNVFEADQYFYDTLAGTYKFDAAKIKDAHLWCLQQTEEQIKHGNSDIAVANTFTRRWEMEPYYAFQQNYDVTIVEVTVSVQLDDDELAARNVHSVPVSTIFDMRCRWEL